MKILELQCNHMTNPLGFGYHKAVLSFQICDVNADDNVTVKIIVSGENDFHDILFDSGDRKDINNAAYELPLVLLARKRYYWKVIAIVNHGEKVESETAWFETAKGENEVWNAKFITQPFTQDIHPVFRKDFEINKQLLKARIYILGLGVYELYLNGVKVGDECLLPGIFAYDKWLQYQTFELDVKQGMNSIDIVLGEGWYKGEYSIAERRDISAKYTTIAEIRISYTDGTELIIGTDETWNVRRGNVLFDGIYDGEIYDSRIHEEKEYAAVLLSTIAPELKDVINTKKLSPRLSPRILIQERIKPVLLETKKNELVLDMKQNMVGWLEFYCDVPAGTTIHMQFGEILQDGCFYRDNLRTAKSEFTYISDGIPRMVRQHFTFYGFRYVKVEGFPYTIDANNFTGCVIYSEMKEIGQISTENPMINRLISNVKWGQKGNFLDTATDCPQRDERMGWTGDAQVFSDTACFNMDTYAFYTKYLYDLWEEQKNLNGSVPYTVPCSRYTLNGSSGWGDAATVIPWNMYLHYGDSTILIRQYDSMKAWVEYMHQDDMKDGNCHLWKMGRHFGDWLALDGDISGGVYGATDRYLISSAYYYYSTLITAKAARVIDNQEDYNKYWSLSIQIREAFISEYFTGNGRLSVDTQTAYSIVIVMNLYPKEHEQRIYRDFRKKMRSSDFKLQTGFLGTPFLCHALVRSNNVDLAYSLLLNEEYPGWLYEVKMGATTVWERWNSVLPDGKISGIVMNSLNHYAYGAILGWIYRDVLGINPIEEYPGFKKVQIAPKPDARLGSILGELQSPYGKYSVHWKIKDTILILCICVPFDCEAIVEFPRTTHYKQVRLRKNSCNCEFSIVNDKVFGICRTGNYEFIITPNEPYRSYLSTENTIQELLANKTTKNVIKKYFPDYLEGIPFQKESKSMKDIMGSPFLPYSQNIIEEFERELRKCQELDTYRN